MIFAISKRPVDGKSPVSCVSCARPSKLCCFQLGGVGREWGSFCWSKNGGCVRRALAGAVCCVHHRPSRGRAGRPMCPKGSVGGRGAVFLSIHPPGWPCKPVFCSSMLHTINQEVSLIQAARASRERERERHRRRRRRPPRTAGWVAPGAGCCHKKATPPPPSNKTKESITSTCMPSYHQGQNHPHHHAHHASHVRSL